LLRGLGGGWGGRRGGGRKEGRKEGRKRKDGAANSRIVKKKRDSELSFFSLSLHAFASSATLGALGEHSFYSSFSLGVSFFLLSSTSQSRPASDTPLLPGSGRIVGVVLRRRFFIDDDDDDDDDECPSLSAAFLLDDALLGPSHPSSNEPRKGRTR